MTGSQRARSAPPGGPGSGTKSGVRRTRQPGAARGVAGCHAPARRSGPGPARERPPCAGTPALAASGGGYAGEPKAAEQGKFRAASERWAQGRVSITRGAGASSDGPGCDVLPAGPVRRREPNPCAEGWPRPVGPWAPHSGAPHGRGREEPDGVVIGEQHPAVPVLPLHTHGRPTPAHPDLDPTGTPTRPPSAAETPPPQLPPSSSSNRGAFSCAPCRPEGDDETARPRSAKRARISGPQGASGEAVPLGRDSRGGVNRRQGAHEKGIPRRAQPGASGQWGCGGGPRTVAPGPCGRCRRVCSRSRQPTAPRAAPTRAEHPTCGASASRLRAPIHGYNTMR